MSSSQVVLVQERSLQHPVVSGAGGVWRSKPDARRPDAGLLYHRAQWKALLYYTGAGTGAPILQGASIPEDAAEIATPMSIASTASAKKPTGGFT
jgi:hypothetical protein